MSTPKVDYVYADGSANTIRREGYVQPNGQPVEYLYDYPAGDNLSRVGSLVVGAPADGLRAFWKLDENISSGPRQDSVGNDTLTDANNNVGVGTGLFGGQAALFDASAATALYTYPTPANLEFGNQDFTTAGWIQYTSFPGVGGTIGAWGNGNAGNANPLEQEWILYVLRTDKHLRWLVSDGTHYAEVDSGVAVALNTWYFVVAWYDAAQGRVYVQVNNGTPVYASYTYGPSARNRGFALGRTNDNFMSGLIQNVGVWDRVLTADERTALYNSGSGVQFFNHARYSYLGASAPVVVDYLQPQVQYNLATGSGAGLYAGLDRFGRVVDNRWQTMTSSPSDVARQQYGYDRASNRLWREDPVAKAQTTPKYFDELYNYDAVYRLTGMQRGQLTGTPPSGVSNKNFAQGWNLDPTGNWKGFTEAATGGSNTLVQSRTANPVNEITDITNTTGSAWAQPGYDAAGNMTSVPKPADMSATYQAKYDAWNRLVELRDPTTGNLVQVNQYDGLTRRTVQQTFDSSGTLAEERHYYYSDSWQVLEERVGSTPESAAPDRRYVWGLRYIDDLVLRDRSVSGGTLNERLFALQDANWNVVALCDTAGAVQQRFAYSPYGVPLFLNADFTAGSNSKDWETLLCGYRWERVSELYLIRLRPYDPIIGVFVTRDPKSPEFERNIYSYADLRPHVAIDPLGDTAVEIMNWDPDPQANQAIPYWEVNSIPGGAAGQTQPWVKVTGKCVCCKENPKKYGPHGVTVWFYTNIVVNTGLNRSPLATILGDVGHEQHHVRQVDKGIRANEKKIKEMFPDDQSQCVFDSEEDCNKAAYRRLMTELRELKDLINGFGGHRADDGRLSGPDQMPRSGKSEPLISPAKLKTDMPADLPWKHPPEVLGFENFFPLF